MIYLQPRLDVMGKRPIWLEVILPLFSKKNETGKMGSGARNLKFFWFRHYIWMVVVFLLRGGSSVLGGDVTWTCGYF